jgi:hypothetical protein
MMPGMPTVMNDTTSGQSSNYTTSVALHSMPTGTVTFQYRGGRSKRRSPPSG